MEDFKALIQSPTPVLANFSREGRKPSKTMDATLEKLKPELEDKVCVVRIDVDVHKDLVSDYYIFAAPTLLLFKDGEVKWRQIGVIAADKLMDKLRRYCK